MREGSVVLFIIMIIIIIIIIIIIFRMQISKQRVLCSCVPGL